VFHTLTLSEGLGKVHFRQNFILKRIGYHQQRKELLLQAICQDTKIVSFWKSGRNNTVSFQHYLHVHVPREQILCSAVSKYTGTRQIQCTRLSSWGRKLVARYWYRDYRWVTCRPHPAWFTPAKVHRSSLIGCGQGHWLHFLCLCLTYSIQWAALQGRVLAFLPV
jgi:hypothetical protein